MKNAITYRFMVFGSFGKATINVITSSIPDAVKLAENFEIDGQRPIKVELIDERNLNVKFLGGV
jgi:hypothetical protein